MPLPAREITGNEIKPGATLAAGQLRGRLVFTASTLGNDERGPFIQFSIAKRINFGSEYVAQTGQRSLIFTIVFSLFAPKGADDAATRKQMLAELDALRDTMNTPQRTATVDCTGAKVIFRALSDEEYKANRICIEAFGPRTLMLNDAERVFVQPPKPLQESSMWSFNSPSPSPDIGITSRPLARTNSKDLRPVTEHQRPHLELLAAARQPLPSRGATTRVPANNKGKGRAVEPGPTRTSAGTSMPASSRPGGGGGRMSLPLGITSFDSPGPAPPSTPDAIESVPSSNISIDEFPPPSAPTAAFDRREQMRLARAEEERLERERALRDVQARMAEEAGPSKRRRVDEPDHEFEGPPVTVGSSPLKPEQFDGPQEPQTRLGSHGGDVATWMMTEEYRDGPEVDWRIEMAVKMIRDEGLTREEAAAEVGLVLPSCHTERPRLAATVEEERKKLLEAQARSAAEANARKAAEERVALQREATRATEAQTHLLEAELHAESIVYTPLAQVRDGSFANVMGVVVDAKEPKHPRHGKGNDWNQTVIITDPSLHKPGREREDFAVTVFRKTGAELGGFEVGAPVLFRCLKISQYNDKLKGNLFTGVPIGSTGTPGWAVLRSPNVVPGKGQLLKPPTTPIEGDRLNMLGEWWRKLGVAVAQNRPAHAGAAGQDGETNGRQVTLLEQVRPNTFFAMTVKLLFLVPNDFNKRYELYVTDGTVNPAPTRNFHNIDAQIPPSAVICLTVFDTTQHQASLFEVGKFYTFKNLRSKDRNGLELNWSDKVTEKQAEDGWRPKAVIVVPRESEEAQEIEARFKTLQQVFKGGVPPPPPPRRQSIPPPVPAAGHAFPADMRMVVPVEIPARVPDFPPPLESDEPTIHVGTTYVDEISHPTTSLTSAFANSTVPNRYRVRARVLSIQACGLPNFENDLAVFYCRKCRHSFKFDYCMSCGDKQHVHATCRWEMILELQDPANPGTTWPAILSDAEAEIMLPALPTIHGGANEVKRARNRIKELTARVHEVLMGARVSGVRPHYVIDMTLQSHIVRSGKNQILVYSVFGMKAAR